MTEHLEEIDIDPAVKAAMDGLPSDFSEFPRVFEQRIRPVLIAREMDRQKAANRARQYRMYGVGVGLVGAIAAAALFQSLPAAFLGVVAGFGIDHFGRAPLRKISSEAKSLLVQPIANQFLLKFIEDPGEQPLVQSMKTRRLLPGYDRAKFEDRIEGARNGVDFEFFEAHLEERRTERSSNGATRTKWVTVFRGQVLRFDFHKRFFGETLVSRDMGFFNRFGGFGSKLDRARLEDPEFEKRFEVYTSDQVEARFLLTPDVMARLLDLENTFKGAKLRCNFFEGQLFLALEGGDMFEPGSMFTPLDNPDRVREVLDDFAVLFRLIDDLSPRIAANEVAHQ